jgi:phosphate transport system substrate-binding protein
VNRTLERITGYAVIVLILAVIGSVVGFISYSAGSASAIRSTIVETGSSLQAPLFAEWSPAYQQSHQGVLVAAASTDSGTGITDAANGLAAIGAADLPAGSVKGVISIPVTVAGVAVVYNLPGISSVHLNGQVLAAIYAGRITSWDDPAIRALNPGVRLPALAIRPLERSDSSGTTYQFTSYLQAQSSTGWPTPAKTQNWPAGTQEQGSNAMVSGCGLVKGCVAYVGVSYEGVATTQYKLGIAALADGAGKFLLPTRENIARAVAQFAPLGQTVLIGATNGYPIVNYEYVVVRPLQTSGQAATAIRQFLDWALTTGSTDKYLSSLNFEPLPASVLAASKELTGEIR